MSRRALTTPWGVFWALGSMLALPLLLLLSPPGLLEDDPAIASQVLQLALLSGVLGSALAMRTLEEARWLFESASPGRSQLAQLCGLASGAGLGWILVGLSVGIQFGSPAFPAAEDLFLGFFSVVQLTLLAALLLHLPALPRGMAGALLLFAVLVLPALFQGPNPTLVWLSALVDVHPSIAQDEESLWARLLVDAGPIVFLGALLGLLHSKRNSPPTRP